MQHFLRKESAKELVAMDNSVFTDATESEQQQQQQRREAGEDVGDIPLHSRGNTPTISNTTPTPTPDRTYSSSFSVTTRCSDTKMSVTTPSTVSSTSARNASGSIHQMSETSSMRISEILDPYELLAETRHISDATSAVNAEILFDNQAQETATLHQEQSEQAPVILSYNNPHLTPIASDQNPKTALKEYYDQCEPRVTLTKASFVCIIDTSEGQHCPFFTCVFVCPQTGELFVSGHLLNVHFGGDQCHERNGLMWYKTKDKSQFAAAGRALDCFRYRGERDEVERFCKEDPYAATDAKSIEFLGEMYHHCVTQRDLRKIQDLQAKTASW